MLSHQFSDYLSQEAVKLSIKFLIRPNNRLNVPNNVFLVSICDNIRTEDNYRQVWLSSVCSKHCENALRSGNAQW